ncbi:hypothetical protein HNQ75_002461 [Rhizobium flavum]|uniref:Uncharacterized protein n=2 Tax=Pseudorhizobium TaxID=1903858 RepID=A0A7X0DD57_9HYPH|nr:hypothetical protein [Pseudorhizobium flavum]
MDTGLLITMFFSVFAASGLCCAYWYSETGRD